MSIAATEQHKLIFVTNIKAVSVIFQETIVHHPVSKLLGKDILAVWMGLGDLFNQAALLHHQSKLASGDFRPEDYWSERENLEEKDLGNDTTIGAGHYYEMMDRASCVHQAFDVLVGQHVVSLAFRQELLRTGKALADLYQSAAFLSHNAEE